MKSNGFAIICRNRNELACRCRRFRRLAFVCRFSWRDDTRNGTRRDPLGGFPARVSPPIIHSDWPLPGTRLGVYEVTAQIGEGGMGQVYRATDTKLKRQVAIKLLPPSLAADHGRLARFQREAEVLASLNHPNIAHIHGLEESGGVLRW